MDNQKKVRRFLYPVILIFVIGVVICTSMIFMVTSKGWPGSLLHPLPFTGPYEGQVLDATTGRPIGDATITAEWWCHDNPLPDGRGSYFVRSEATSDANGYFRLDKPQQREGWFGSDFSLIVNTRGYIEAVFIVDPNDVSLPPGTVAWPFVDTSSHISLPATLEVKLRPARPVLLEALQSPDPQYRRNAAEGLAEIGPEAHYAIPVLIEALKDEDEWVREYAARALAAIGPGAKDTVPALIEVLRDEEWMVRKHAAIALGEIGSEAKQAVPALIEALEDEEWLVRINATEALKKIAPEALEDVPVQ